MAGSFILLALLNNKSSTAFFASWLSRALGEMLPLLVKHACIRLLVDSLLPG